MCFSVDCPGTEGGSSWLAAKDLRSAVKSHQITSIAESAPQRCRRFREINLLTFSWIWDTEICSLTWTTLDGYGFSTYITRGCTSWLRFSVPTWKAYWSCGVMFNMRSCRDTFFPTRANSVSMVNFSWNAWPSFSKLRGITQSNILLRSPIKPYSLFPWCSMVFTSY